MRWLRVTRTHVVSHSVTASIESGTLGNETGLISGFGGRRAYGRSTTTPDGGFDGNGLIVEFDGGFEQRQGRSDS
jgi:hypothetical protein